MFYKIKEHDIALQNSGKLIMLHYVKKELLWH